MAVTADKLQNALDEARMLVLGAQVLLGFALKSSFEAGFNSLPSQLQAMKMGSLVLLVVTVVVLMAPGAFHQIVERGDASDRIHEFATRCACWALLPFAASLGVEAYVSAERVGGHGLGLGFGIGSASVALFFWYGLGLFRWNHRKRLEAEQDREKESMSTGDDGHAKLKDKIKEVLTEARVVLPGAQALAGFQFIAILMESFERLSKSLQYIHLASMGFVVLGTILLMTPAAYHRVVERGENSEHFHRFASRTLLAAMAVLPLGICGDIYVVFSKVFGEGTMPLAVSGVLLAACYGLWFGLTGYLRYRREARNAPHGREPVSHW